MKVRWLAGIAVSLVVSGCGDWAKSSCNERTGDWCKEYLGAGWSHESARSDCGQSDYRAVEGCSHLAVIGVCTRAANSTSETKTFFYGPQFDSAQAQAYCFQTGGMFTRDVP